MWNWAELPDCRLQWINVQQQQSPYELVPVLRLSLWKWAYRQATVMKHPGKISESMAVTSYFRIRHNLMIGQNLANNMCQPKEDFMSSISYRIILTKMTEHWLNNKNVEGSPKPKGEKKILLKNQTEHNNFKSMPLTGKHLEMS